MSALIQQALDMADALDDERGGADRFEAARLLRALVARQVNLRPNGTTFSLAADLQEVAIWIAHRHIANEYQDQAKALQRVMDFLRGVHVVPSRDLDWLLRNDPFVASLYARLRVEMERRRETSDTLIQHGP